MESDAVWHTMEVEETAAQVRSNVLTGLTEKESQARLEVYGQNVLPQPVPRSLLQILSKQFQSLPVLLLILNPAVGAVVSWEGLTPEPLTEQHLITRWVKCVAVGTSIKSSGRLTPSGSTAGFRLIGSSVLSLVTGGVADAVVILGVVVLNAVIGTTTESKSEYSIAALLKGTEPTTTVLRDGAVFEIGGEDVVPGDILVLSRGSYVPADARLLSTDRLSVDESALTGESVSAEKSIQPLSPRIIPLGDRSNMVYRGTVITGGSGRAIVVNTASSHGNRTRSLANPDL